MHVLRRLRAYKLHYFMSLNVYILIVFLHFLFRFDKQLKKIVLLSFRYLVIWYVEINSMFAIRSL